MALRPIWSGIQPNDICCWINQTMKSQLYFYCSIYT